MKLIRTIANCCLVFIVVIAVCVIIAFVYYHYFVHDTTIGVNNINDQLGLDVVSSDDLTDEQKDEYEERWFMQANYYSNAKNNGVELQELQYNYFTGYNLTSAQYRSTGMQFLGDFRTYTQEVYSEKEGNERVLNEFYYYDTTNGITWSGFKGQYGSVSTVLNRNQQFIIKIDNRPFAIQLDGQYDVYGRLWGFLWTVKQGTVMFDYGDVFDAVFSAIKSNDKGYGDYYITLDLSQYFTVREYDTTTGKFKADDVTDIIKNYAVLKFHYDENGARNSSQSIFGSIECNPKYDTNEDKVDTTYWQERVTYTLTETSKLNGKEIFTYRYSETYGGYFLALTMDCKKLFAEMPRAKVNIMLDLQSAYWTGKEINIVGFDYNAFDGFEIDTLTITSKAEITFYMLENALNNTGLKTLQHSRDIVFEGLEYAINNEYNEVLI